MIFSNFEMANVDLSTVVSTPELVQHLIDKNGQLLEWLVDHCSHPEETINPLQGLWQLDQEEQLPDSRHS
jgi:hypothetical protein